jgi:general secretion pathway protein F
MRKAAEQARLEVEQGERLHRALGQHDAFPAMMVQLVASGEQGGELEAMLVRASRLQQRDNDMRISALLALLEPLLVVIMGGFVLLIVLAVLMPVFELNTLVK